MIPDFLVSSTCVREGKRKEYEEMCVFVKRRLVQAQLQGQVPPKAPNKWQRCIVFENHSLESTGHHCGKTPVAQASPVLKPTHKGKQVNSSEGKTLLESSGGWAGLYLSQTQGSGCALGLSFSCLEQRLWLFDYYRTWGDKGRGQGMLDNY